MKFILTCLIFLFPLLTIAQTSDPQLAYTYYHNKEYEKAAEMFLQLYERTRSANFLDYHIICLINGTQYDKAEELLKKLLKTDDSNFDLLTNLGFVYEQQGRTKKTEECYEKAIDKLVPSNIIINNLAYKFRNLREYDWAIKTYTRGRELLKQPDAFMSELGDNYMMARNYDKMFELFVQVLETQPGEINNITSKLSFARSSDIINNVDAVIERYLEQLFRQANYNPVFDELAVWYALQKNNDPKALQHAIALNRKMDNKLHIFLNIARSAASSANYEIARQAYGKVLEKGKENNNFYIAARKEILNCEYENCRRQTASESSFRNVAGECEKYMQEYGYNHDNTDIIVLLSDIYAYHLNLPDSANRILEKGTAIRQLNPNTMSMLKSKRADLLAFMDNPWEATILYTQIEKANPNNDIGYEAKLKKAWLAYYSGDLQWAKAQFDVLKGATSKLISNDAIRMAHFIHSNYEEDHDNPDFEKMARTEYLIYKQQGKEALPILDSIINNCQPELADHATLIKAKHLAANFRYTEAMALLQRLKDISNQAYLRAEAIYELAALKVQAKEKAAAQELYKLLVSEYPGSVYSVESGLRYRELDNEKTVNN